MENRKKIIVLLSASLLLMQACKKNSSSPVTSSTTTTQTVEATVAKSTTYSYTLPASTGAYSITTQSSHAAASIIANTSGNVVYNYTAGNTFTGIDTVIISEVDSNCMHGNSTHTPHPCDSNHMPPPPPDSNGHGPCPHPHGPKPGGAQIIFHINVKDGNVAQ